MSKDEKDYDSVAYDVTYDFKKKMYNLVTIGYDSETKQGEVLSKKPIGDSRLIAVINAKKAIVDRVLAINIDNGKTRESRNE